MTCEETWRSSRRACSPSWSALSTTNSNLIVDFAGSDKLAGHISNQYRSINFRETLNGVDKAISADKTSLFFTSITDAAYNPQKVESYYCFVGLKLL